MARKPKLGLPLQTLRNAPDALEGRRLRGGIFEIDPAQIVVVGRLDDRLRIEVDGLRASIGKNGQRVPILVRPLDGDRYGLIYGRRRLEACRELGLKVRAIVTEADDSAALRDQLIENQERRDLSFIERAMVAAALIEGEHLAPADRTNKGVADVLSLTEAGVSQLLGVVRSVGEDLIQAIGPAPGIGRPRWEDLKRALCVDGIDRRRLLAAASEGRAAPDQDTGATAATDLAEGSPGKGSDTAFLAVLQAARQQVKDGPGASRALQAKTGLDMPGVGTVLLKAGPNGKRLRLDLAVEDKGFIDWLEGHAPQLITELHARWKRTED